MSIPKHVRNWCEHAHFYDLVGIQSLAEEIMESRRQLSSLTSADTKAIKGLSKVRAIKYIRDKYKIPIHQCLTIYDKYK